MKQSSFPAGWDEARVRRLIDHYEKQSAEAVAENDAASLCEQKKRRIMKSKTNTKSFKSETGVYSTDGAAHTEHMHLVSCLVENHPGVLARISGMFSSRGYN